MKRYNTYLLIYAYIFSSSLLSAAAFDTSTSSLEESFDATSASSSYKAERIPKRSKPSTSSDISDSSSSSSLDDSYFNAIAYGERNMLIRLMQNDPEGINRPFAVTPWGEGMLDQEIEMPPLMFAIYCTSHYEISMLLDKDNGPRISARIPEEVIADPDYTTDDGICLLEYAFRKKQLNTFQKLLNCGAHTEVISSDRKPLLTLLQETDETQKFVHALQQARKQRAAEMLSEKEICRILKTRGKRKCDLV